MLTARVEASEPGASVSIVGAIDLRVRRPLAPVVGVGAAAEVSAVFVGFRAVLFAGVLFLDGVSLTSVSL